jgi:hypothetical protein
VWFTGPRLLDPSQKLIHRGTSQEGALCLHQKVKTARRGLDVEFPVIAVVPPSRSGRVAQVAHERNPPESV